jgi:hypothetical protein
MRIRGPQRLSVLPGSWRADSSSGWSSSGPREGPARPAVTDVANIDASVVLPDDRQGGWAAEQQVPVDVGVESGGLVRVEA